ncbi:MAG TPA: conjugal transfer protein TraL [Acetobacteraceae bacterium]|nr:conjugal transfer protein TraL [Acetobacteraceae bacterium]
MPDTSPPAEASTTTRSSARTTAAASSAKTEPRKLHFVLQGKGGVGKTFVSLLLAQAIAARGEPLICVDTDPVNASFSGLSVMEPERVSIFEGKKVDTKALDRFIERLLSEDAHFVVDNGAASFVPMSQYLLENDVVGMMLDDGRQPVLHTVITGGPAMLDTVKGLAALMEDFPPSVRLVVWLNEFFGPIVNTQGKSFEELPVYAGGKDRIFALVHLPMVSEEASTDLRDMIARRLTFDQALARENTTILRVQKSRLFKYREAVWPEIGRVI